MAVHVGNNLDNNGINESEDYIRVSRMTYLRETFSVMRGCCPDLLKSQYIAVLKPDPAQLAAIDLYYLCF